MEVKIMKYRKEEFKDTVFTNTFTMESYYQQFRSRKNSSK